MNDQHGPWTGAAEAAAAAAAQAALRAGPRASPASPNPCCKSLLAKPSHLRGDGGAAQAAERSGRRRGVDAGGEQPGGLHDGWRSVSVVALPRCVRVRRNAEQRELSRATCLGRRCARSVALRSRHGRGLQRPPRCFETSNSRTPLHPWSSLSGCARLEAPRIVSFRLFLRASFHSSTRRSSSHETRPEGAATAGASAGPRASR